MRSQWVSGLLITSIVLAIASIIISYLGYHKRRASELWVTHTYQVIGDAHKMLSNVMDAEGSQRSFLLTGDTTYLSPYRASVNLVEKLVDSLRKLTQDNASQTKLLDEKIIPWSGYKLREWKNTMNILDEENRENAILFLEAQHGNTVLDSLWLNTKTFIANEELLLTDRNATVEFDNYVNNAIRYTSFLIVALASMLALATIRRQQRENNVLVEGLKNLNLDLETRIKERTLDLKNKNDYVEKLNVQLQQSNEEVSGLHEALKIRNKHAEESLREIRDLYDNAPCGYHSIDKNGFVARMNKTELNWLGYPESEVIGKMHIRQIVSSAYMEEREQNIKKLIETGHLENIEFDMIRKDGSTFSVLMSSSAIFDVKGNFIKNRSTLFDISRRKQLEEKLLIANDHLVLLNDEKNRFIGMTSHDLKNPLNGIAGLIHLLKTQTTLSVDQSEYVSFIEDSVIRMKNLISKLLDLNRIEQEGNIVQKQKINLQTFLDRIIKGFEEVAHKKNIQLLLLNPLGPLHIETDPTLLEQAIDNFISNAIKFSTSGKKVWMRTARLTDNLMIEIEDQGPGIKPEEIPRLFGAFQKLSAQPTGGEPSTGLGLSIAKGLVRALGGEIKVESEIGKGSKFIFVIKI